MNGDDYNNSDSLLKETLTLSKSKYPKLRLFVDAVIFLNIILLCMLVVLGLVTRNSEKEMLKLKVTDDIDSIKNVLQLDIKDILSDLFFTRKLVENLVKEEIKDEFFESDITKKILADFLEFKFKYDHIRLLGNDGMELVRINRAADGGVEAVSEDKLQDKSSRYYYVESLSLEPNMAYISFLDFNKEYGEYELPYKLMLRASVPIYLRQELESILIVNFLGIELINDIILILQQSPQRNKTKFYFLNGKSQALAYIEFQEDGEVEIIVNPQVDELLQHELSQSNSGILKQDEGVEFTENNTLISVSTFHSESVLLFDEDCYDYSISGGSNTRSHYNMNDLILVSVTPVDTFLTHIKNLIVDNFYALLFTEFFFIIVAILYSSMLYKQKKLENEIKTAAAYDSLTSVYNRRFGLLFLKYEIKKIKRSNDKLSLIVIDIDNLKKVNDKCGHSSGDELIRLVTDEIKNNVREYDIICRTGGDEFFVAFTDAVLADAAAVLIRVRESLKKKYCDKFKGVGIGFSFGGAEYSQTGYSSVEEFMAVADSKMYEDKKKRKIERES